MLLILYIINLLALHNLPVTDGSGKSTAFLLLSLLTLTVMIAIRVGNASK